MNTRKTLLGSALVLYFVIAFEVLIMISPFAGFFYSVFNPVLLKLAGHPSDVHNMRLLGVKDLAHGSGWGTVPAPVF